MIEKFYDKLENDHNLQGFLKQSMEKARNEDHKVQIIIDVAKQAGIALTEQEFKAYQGYGIEKITQTGLQ